MHDSYVRLRIDETVGDALAKVREHPPSGRLFYFYVLDHEGRLLGVVSTRLLMVSRPEQPVSEIMSSDVATLPVRATARQACEFFLKNSIMAVPVVDDEGRIQGVIDVDRFAKELARLRARNPVQRLLEPLTRFLEIESASGLVLLAAAIVAMSIANSQWAAQYAAFWHTPIGISIGAWSLRMPLDHWINDGLMTLFFFVMGLEIKREFLFGELNDRFKATLPIIAAAGGMFMPAVVFLTVIALSGGSGASGWGIPTATDIAFTVGFLTLLGSRVPRSLKVLLLTLAIVDDIGATLIIALAYGDEISRPALLLTLAGFVVIVLVRLLGVRRIAVYVLLGAATWFACLKSGVHPTIAGVALGLLTPATSWLGDRIPMDLAADLFRRLRGRLDDDDPDTPEPASPLDRLQQGLHPWVAFGIMPIFALANAGVAIDWRLFAGPITIAVAAGLIVGKPLGILAASWLSVRLGLAKFPQGIRPLAYLGIGCLAGIGFTMSLFIARLALHDTELDEAKLGIMFGSIVSAILGLGLLWWFLPRANADGREQ